MFSHCPVRGGLRPSSLARWLRTATKLPPAEVPPMIKPFSGLALSFVAFSAACRIADSVLTVHLWKETMPYPFERIPGIVNRNWEFVLR